MKSLPLAGALALALTSLPLAATAQSASGQGAAQANTDARVPPATTTVTTQNGQTVITRDNPGNLAPPPASALNKDYPPCSKTVQDHCRNKGGR